MLFSPGTGQSFDEGGLVGFAARLTEAGQDLGVPFSGDDRAEYLQPGDASDVRQDVMELQVHLLQCLLHMQNVRGTMLDQFSPVAQVGSQDNHFGVRSEGAIEQAQPVQLL